MADRENREDWRRERSLLALGQAMRGEEGARPSSLLSVAAGAPPSWQDDAAERHRLARSRREAKPNPLLSALGNGSERQPEVEPLEAAPAKGPSATDGVFQKTAAQNDDQPALGKLLPSWMQLRRSRDPVTDKPAQSEEARGFEPLPPLRTEPEIAAKPVVRPTIEPATLAHAPRDDTFFEENEDSQQWKPLIDPMKVVGGVMRSKLLIVATTLLGALLGIAIAVSTPKKYEATTELIVDPRDLKLTDRDLTQNVVASDATLAIVENQVRVLTSGTVLNKVVDKLNLVNDPEFNGTGGGLSVMSFVRSLLSRDDGPGGVDDVRRRALAINNLAESLSVERGGKTFVITVSVTTQDGDKSALIANTMTDEFLKTFGQIQSDTAGRATDELTARLDELRKGLEAAERKVEEFRASHDLVDAQGHLISDDELLKLNEQLSVARARTLELNARAASARSINVDSVLGGTLPEEINSNAMADLRSQYANLKAEADRAAVRLGPRHPERMALDAQLAGARDRIASELRRIASSLQVDLKRSVQLEQELASRLAQLKVRSGDVNNDLVALRELEREATAKRSVYESYLLRAKETGEQRDINTANINVISKAYPPLEANGPSRAVVAIAGMMLGLASGVGLGAMRGAYESLRETADARSRRRRPGRRPLRTEDDADRASADPAPVDLASGAATPAGERAGPVGALISAVRKAMPGKAVPVEPISPTDAEAAKPTESPMYPVYPEQQSPFAPQQPMPFGYPQPQFHQPVYPHQVYPHPMQPMMPPQAAYPAPQMPVYPGAYPQPQMVYPQQMPHPQAWQPAPAAYPYPQPMQQAAPMGFGYPQQPPAQPAAMRPAVQPQAAAPEPQQVSVDQTPIEEIRSSLREFRDAVRELTESRSRRRYF